MSDGRCGKSWHGVPCKNPSEHTSMKLTADDLKELKEDEQIKGFDPSNEMDQEYSGWFSIRTDKLIALLARLEAAETALKANHRGMCMGHSGDECTCDANTPEYRSWRQSKGNL